jgi:hypothetical protein
MLVEAFRVFRKRMILEYAKGIGNAVEAQMIASGALVGSPQQPFRGD